jgi:hypothetical protein
MLEHMDEESVVITVQLRKLEKYVRTLPMMRKLRTLDRAGRESLHMMGDTLSEASRLARDAANTEVPDIRRNSLERCREQLEAFRQALLGASQYELVDTVDVAHLSAMADLVNDLARTQQARL